MPSARLAQPYSRSANRLAHLPDKACYTGSIPVSDESELPDNSTLSGLILHIAHRQAWEQALEAGIYTPDGLALEGFIHCSLPEQVAQVANALFRGQPGLVLLCIDSGRVEAPIRYENLEGGRTLFPHIYGALNLDAVLRVLDLVPESDGVLFIPEDVCFNDPAA